ncbi:hypothetical protein CVM73_20215 [Bradyrhizobium forestalis]|uniref:Uncharacterized protein n=1 Tax=Bradyrhizobium forestalis TaxID=1419263 RepID=A0A2M8R6S7_9BRAD|nr:hypothetical protein CVM73_20215 [Bradyrhizobium forestalis]
MSADVRRPAALCAAAYVGSTQLIDNVILGCQLGSAMRGANRAQHIERQGMLKALLGKGASS